MSPPSHHLRAVTLPARRLTPPVTSEMWQVFQAYYTDVDRARFEADLRPKSHVILLRDSGDGSLHGFSTLQTYRRRVEGRKVAVLYSGDTIVDKAYWGQTALQRAWLLNALRLKARHPHLPTYWFLLAKGYKTYLLLSRNFPEYWPRWDRVTPGWQTAVLHQLARERFGDEYDPARGVIRHARQEGRLRDGVAPIDGQALAQRDIRFFAERNPDHHRGDELCCLGRIDLALALRYLTKLARHRRRRPPGGRAGS